VLQGAEGRLAVLGEDLLDRAARALLDHLVAVGERQLQPGREQAPDRGLAGPHEADEDDHGPIGLSRVGLSGSAGSAGSSRPGPGWPAGPSAANSAMACSASREETR